VVGQRAPVIVPPHAVGQVDAVVVKRGHAFAAHGAVLGGGGHVGVAQAAVHHAGHQRGQWIAGVRRGVDGTVRRILRGGNHGADARRQGGGTKNDA